MGRRPIQRILLVRNDRLGDVVLTLPAIEAARRALPDAHLAVLVNRYTERLLASNPHINELILDEPGASARALARRLKPRRFDAALVINTNTRNSLAVWLSRIPLRVLYGYKTPGVLFGNRRVWLHRKNPPVHEAEFALEFVRRLGLPAELAVRQPKLNIDPAALAEVATRIRHDLGGDGPLFGVHPGNFSSAFNWPLKHYIELTRALCRHGRVMLTGGPKEAGLLEEVRSALADVPQGRIAYYHDFSLNQLVAALSLQDVLTISSTGPMHIAGVIGTPVVALFSAHPVQAAEKWAPLGAGHQILRAPLAPGQSPEIPSAEGEAHMAKISVADALAANLRIVARRAKAA
jgi:heptosyltransferase-2